MMPISADIYPKDQELNTIKNVCK